MERQVKMRVPSSSLRTPGRRRKRSWRWPKARPKTLIIKGVHSKDVKRALLIITKEGQKPYIVKYIVKYIRKME